MDLTVQTLAGVGLSTSGAAARISWSLLVIGRLAILSVEATLYGSSGGTTQIAGVLPEKFRPAESGLVMEFCNFNTAAQAMYVAFTGAADGRIQFNIYEDTGSGLVNPNFVGNEVLQSSFFYHIP